MRLSATAEYACLNDPVKAYLLRKARDKSGMKSNGTAQKESNLLRGVKRLLGRKW